MTDTIQEAVLQAVDTIVQTRLESAKLDTTGKAIIKDFYDKAKGIYNVWYNGGVIQAITSSADTTYEEGQSVYILKPGQNKTDTPLILGLDASSRTAVSEITIEDDEYCKIGGDVITPSEDSLFYLPISSDQTQDIYNIESASLISIDKNALKDYATTATSIDLTAEFSVSHLDDTYITAGKGTYGIVIEYLDGSSTETKTLTFSSLDMSGNPLLYKQWTEQTKHFDSVQINTIKRIYLYTKGFTPSNTIEATNDTNYKNCIGFKIPSLFFCKQLEQTGEYAVVIDLDSPGKITKGSTDLLGAKATGYYNLSDAKADKMTYIWGLEDAEIVIGDANYDALLGSGYKVIGRDRQISFKNDSTETTDLFGVILPKYKNNIKVVAYDPETGLSASNTTCILNNNYAYGINFDYVLNDEKYVVSCVITELSTSEIITPINYNWKVINAEDEELPSEAIITSTVEVPLENIETSTRVQVKCDISESVSVKGSITLTKEYVDEDYYIELLHGDNYSSTQYILYDEDGKLMNAPQKITARLRNKNHEVINPESYLGNISWDFPSTGSLISSITTGRNETTLEYEATITVDSIYNYAKLNNKVSCIIQYNGYTCMKEADIRFSKPAENGNNATGEIYYMLDSNRNPYLLLTGKEHTIDNIKNNIHRYKYADGTETELSATSLYLPSVPFRSKYINKSSGSGETYTKLLLTDGSTYFPILLIFREGDNQENLSIRIVENGYPKEVIYSANGNNPIYDTNAKFENIQFYDNQKGEYVNFDSWSYHGGMNENSDTFDDTDLFADNTGKIKDHFDCTWMNQYAEGEYIQIIDGVQYKITLLVPVYAHLNRYSLKNANGWDGSSVVVNEEGKYIATPQILAGKKDFASSTFTGITIGCVDYFTGSAIETETGLFGYNKGEETLFLNADDGDDARDSHIGNWVIGNTYLYNAVSNDGQGGQPLDNDDEYGPAGAEPQPSIQREHRGIKLSANPPYIAIKGRPLTEDETETDFTSVGDSFELELCPESASPFTIYHHYQTGSGLEKSWKRTAVVGIDKKGRFYSNALHDEESSLSLGPMKVFGETSLPSLPSRGLQIENEDEPVFRVFKKDEEDETSEKNETYITVRGNGKEYDYPLSVNAKSITLYADDGSSTGETTNRYISLSNDAITLKSNEIVIDTPTPASGVNNITIKNGANLIIEGTTGGTARMECRDIRLKCINEYKYGWVAECINDIYSRLESAGLMND